MTTAGAGSHPLLGVLLMVLATCCFAAMDNTTRYLGALMPVLLLLTGRYLFQAVVMAVWIAADPRLRFACGHPRFQTVRGLLLMITSAMSFFGLQYMPVAELTSIVMLTPVLVTLMAAWLLKERVTPLRWLLVLGAFGGALLVTRPGSGLFGWAVLLPLTGAVCYASFQVLTSRMAGLDHPLTTHFWTGFVGTAVLVPVLLASPVDITGALAAATPKHWALMTLIGALGTFGHLLLINAFGKASTATLMPFSYVQIPAAAFIGWLVFQQFPDRWALVGMAVITVCGATSAWLNVRAANARGTHPSGPDTVPE